MKRNVLVLLIVLLTLLNKTVFSQVSAYTFSQSNTTYTPITGGSVIGLPYDNFNGYGNIPLGFTFNFNGSNYTEFGMSTAGYIVMGNVPSTSVGADYKILENIPSNTKNDAICAYNDDIEIGFLTTGDYTSGSDIVTNVGNLSGIAIGDQVDFFGTFVPTGTTVTAINTTNGSFTMSNVALTSATAGQIQFGNGEMRVQTIGSAPNRVCVIQWKNAHTFGETNESFNFQIRLYETTNQVQVVYGNYLKGPLPWEVQVGLTGQTRADFNVRTTTTDWNATTAGVSNSICAVNSTLFPATGLTFNWNQCGPSGTPNIVSNLTNNTICGAQNVTLTIVSNNLNGGLNWEWYSGSCTGTVIGTGNSITIPQGANAATYFAKGVGGCNPANGGSCGSVTINYSTPPTVGASASATSICEGYSLTLNGNGAASYIWSNGVIDNVSFLATVTNIYTVTGTDANGCTNTSTIQITVIPSPVISVTATPPSAEICLGQNVTLNATGTGVSWSGSITNNVPFSPTVTTTYTATATGSNGCIATVTQVVTVQSPPSIIIATLPTNPTICGGTSIVLNATGANSYVWSNGIPNNTSVTPTVTTSYTVTGSTSAGCTSTQSITVNVLTAPVVVANSTPASANVCVNSNVVLFGGGAASYSWSGGIQNNVSFPATTSTIYTVTGTAANGCEATSTINLIVNTIPVLTITASPSNAQVCAGENLILTASGASNYTWSNGIQNGVAFIPPNTGVYTVTGVNGTCSATKTQLVVLKALPNINASYSPSSAVCSGAPMTITMSGGTTYTIGNGITNGVSFNPTSSFTTTASGTGANGCVKTITLNVTANQGPIITVAGTPTNLAVCPNTPVTVNGTVSNGTLVWNNGLVNNTPFTPVQTTSYTATATGSNTCTSTTVVTVTVNPIPTVSVNVSPSNTVCSGSTVTVTGTGASSYSYTGGILDNVSFTPNSTNTYTVTGTSSFNCTSTATFDIIVTTSGTLNVVTSPSNTICAGTPVTINATPATNILISGNVQNNVPFNPIISSSYTVTGNSASGCSLSTVVVLTVNALPVITTSASPSSNICPGSSISLNGTCPTANVTWSNNIINNNPFIANVATVYTASATDANGCSTASTIAISLLTTPTFSINAIPSNFTVCDGGVFQIQLTGAPSFSISGGITNNSPFTANFSNAGTYTATATGSNGCTASNTFNINVTQAPVASISSIPSTPIVCLGQSITLSGNGGASGTWNNGIQNGITFTPTATGTYQYQINNGPGCVSNASVIVTVNPLPTFTLFNPYAPDNIICEGTPVNLSITSNASVTWANGYVNGTDDFPTTNTNYTFTVTDVSTGCTVSDVVPFIVNPLPTYTVAHGSTVNICPNQPMLLNAITDPNNFIDWNVSGIGSIPNNTTFNTNNQSTVFYLTLIDLNNGCELFETFNLNVAPKPVFTIANIVNKTLSVCQGGSLLLNAIGPDTYVWSNGVTNGNTFIPTQNGSLTVTATTINGCTGVEIVNLNVDTIPIYTINTSPSNISNQCQNSLITLTASPTNNISYVWTSNFNDIITNGVAFAPQGVGNNIYQVTATGANGCTAISSITYNLLFNQPPVLTATSVNGNPNLCANTPILMSLSGASTYSSTPSFNIGGSNTINSLNTIYTITGTQANGCSMSTIYTLTLNTFPSLNITRTPSTGAVCQGASAILTTTTNMPSATIVWSNNVINGVPFQLNATNNFTVTATSPLGCVNVGVVPFSVINGLVTLNTSPASGSICPGKTFTLSPVNVVANTVTITPTAPIGVAIPSPSVPTTYTLAAISTINGCLGTITKTITPVGNPTINVSYAPSTPICQGPNMTITPTGAQTYTVVPANVSLTAPFPTTNILNTTVYTVTGRSAYGCTSTTTFQLSNINRNPVFNVSGQGAVCYGATTKYQGVPTTNTYSYTPAYVNNTPYVITAPDTYTVTATGTNGCTSTKVASHTIKPLPTFTVTKAFDSLCSNTPNTFSITPSSAGTHSIYVAGGLKYNTAVAGTTYTSAVTATQNNVMVLINVQLFNATTACNALQNIAYFSKTGATVNLNQNNVTVNVNSPVTLNATGNCSTYVWTNGITNNVPFNATVSNIYTVTGTNVNGCTITNIATVTVVTPKPIQTDYTIDDLAVTDKINSQHLNFSVSNHYDAVASFEIEKTNNLSNEFKSIGNLKYLPTATDKSSYEFIDLDNNEKSFYRVNLLDASGQSLGYSNMVNYLGEFVLNAYPNPTSNMCNLEIKTTEEKEVVVHIIDALGKIKHRVQSQINPSQNRVELDFSNLPSGMYQVNVISNNEVLGTSKIIKQ